jgi:hypothetical protein
MAKDPGAAPAAALVGGRGPRWPGLADPSHGAAEGQAELSSLAMPILVSASAR